MSDSPMRIVVTSDEDGRVGIDHDGGTPVDLALLLEDAIDIILNHRDVAEDGR